ncbi:MAG: polysaccharide pyruvyl transferase WcaK-like protein [Francisellaceae bacterium]|jgi:polysaccharide pyruvyl transferase WcaK-like protein
MLFEIRGIGFPNKGAELMLIAVTEQISKHYPDAEYVVDMNYHYLSRAKYGLYQKIWLSKLGLKSQLLSAIIPLSIKKRLGIKDSKDIDVIIDASGFRYTKQWGINATNTYMANHIKHWHNQNKKIIFMPQAWGPFDNSFKDSISKIVKYSDLLIARDSVSKDNVEKLTGSNNVKHYPDFSNLLQPKAPEFFCITVPDNGVAIVPNCRMLDKMKKSDAQIYPNILKQFILDLEEKGYTPFFLMHEGVDDEKIALTINSTLEHKIEILRHDDPLVLKGIISKCEFIIGSRFHALVSALSQGVPVISMGWSHKYNLLMQDYGLDEYLIESGVTLGECSILLDRLIAKLEHLKITVLDCANIEKDKTKAMWAEVISVIEK